MAHPGPSKYDARYWRSRLIHRQRGSYVSAEWSVRLQHAGRRETFSLNTANIAKASAGARDIAVFLKANGWAAT